MIASAATRLTAALLRRQCGTTASANSSNAAVPIATVGQQRVAGRRRQHLAEVERERHGEHARRHQNAARSRGATSTNPRRDPGAGDLAGQPEQQVRREQPEPTTGRRPQRAGGDEQQHDERMLHLAEIVLDDPIGAAGRDRPEHAGDETRPRAATRASTPRRRRPAPARRARTPRARRPTRRARTAASRSAPTASPIATGASARSQAVPDRHRREQTANATVATTIGSTSSRSATRVATPADRLRIRIGGRRRRRRRAEAERERKRGDRRVERHAGRVERNRSSRRSRRRS